MTTPWQDHVERWGSCRKCGLCNTRRKVVLARGSVPADVLLIGEAPGESENIIGQPFIGSAGKLLDQIVDRAMDAGIRRCFTNLVACIPRDEDNNKTEEPSQESVQACKPRLQELVELCNPKLIVAVGTCARDWLDWKRKGYIKFYKQIPTIDIAHPAYILRINMAQQGLLVQRCIVTIRKAVEEYCHAEDR